LEEQIRKEYKAEIVGVFGSYARGNKGEVAIWIFSPSSLKELPYSTLLVWGISSRKS
jgi:hypothetical protein